jgi:hypothetical protein
MSTRKPAERTRREVHRHVEMRSAPTLPLDNPVKSNHSRTPNPLHPSGKHGAKFFRTWNDLPDRESQGIAIAVESGDVHRLEKIGVSPNRASRPTIDLAP